MTIEVSLLIALSDQLDDEIEKLKSQTCPVAHYSNNHVALEETNPPGRIGARGFQSLEIIDPQRDERLITVCKGWKHWPTLEGLCQLKARLNHYIDAAARGH